MPSRQTGDIGGDDRSGVAPAAIRELLSVLAASGLSSHEIDVPSDPSGEWFIDLAIDGLNTTVSYRPDFGFGVFTSAPMFGARPDEVYRDPRKAAIRLRQLASQWAHDARLTSPSLRELRQIMEMHQAHVAEAWRGGGNQTAISKLEMRNDHKLSTIHDYVTALGGELELRVRFAGFETPIQVSGLSPGDAVRSEPAFSPAELMAEVRRLGFDTPVESATLIRSDRDRLEGDGSGR